MNGKPPLVNGTEQYGNRAGVRRHADRSLNTKLAPEHPDPGPQLLLVSLVIGLVIIALFLLYWGLGARDQSRQDRTVLKAISVSHFGLTEYIAEQDQEPRNGGY